MESIFDKINLLPLFCTTFMSCGKCNTADVMRVARYAKQHFTHQAFAYTAAALYESALATHDAATVMQLWRDHGSFIETKSKSSNVYRVLFRKKNSFSCSANDAITLLQHENARMHLNLQHHRRFEILYAITFSPANTKEKALMMREFRPWLVTDIYHVVLEIVKQCECKGIEAKGMDMLHCMEMYVHAHVRDSLPEDWMHGIPIIPGIKNGKLRIAAYEYLKSGTWNGRLQM